MNQPYVDIDCACDYWKTKRFYFLVNEAGLPLPNYCEDFNNSDTCKQCAVKALEKLIEETPRHRSGPEFNDPLQGHL